MQTDDFPAIWPTNIRAAKKMRQEVGKRILLTRPEKPPALVAAADASFSKEWVFAAACLYTYPGLELYGQAWATLRVVFPYMPGYLAFREGPAIVKAIEGLPDRPDVLMFDGHGIAHPEGAGIASHIGVLFGLPSVGCAKAKLVGTHEKPGQEKGSIARLMYRAEAVGAVLRTCKGVKPVYVSPGHLMDVQSAIDIVLGCTSRYRIPEPLRCADALSRKIKAEAGD